MNEESQRLDLKKSELPMGPVQFAFHGMDFRVVPYSDGSVAISAVVGSGEILLASRMEPPSRSMFGMTFMRLER